MDLQDNIILIIKTPTQEIKKTIQITSYRTKYVLFSIKEFDDAEVLNNSQLYDLYFEDIDNGGERKVSYGERFVVNSNDHPNPTLEYRLRALNKDTNKSLLFLYKIVPTSSTTESQYKEMISAIGRYDEKLLYEDDLKYLGGKVFESDYKSSLSISALVASGESTILNSLNSIENHPLFISERIVTKTPSLQKQSSRSIIKNSRTARSDVFYSSRIVQNYNTPLNRYLVFMLRFSAIRLGSLIEDCKKELMKTNVKMLRILEKADSDPSKRKPHTIHQIESLERKTNLLNRFISSFEVETKSINRVLMSPNFSKIEQSSIRDKQITYHSHYLNIERRMFLPLFQGFALSFSSNYNSILSSPIKQTSKLFEAYSLFAIDAAITELGFEDVTEEIDYSCIVKTFARDEYEFSLYYSLDAKDVSLAKENDFYYIVSNTKHVSPDFFLILKKNNNPICFMLFDSKCRKVEYVDRDIKEGNYEKTIRDYLSLRYSTDQNPFFLPKTVDTFWLLFPNDGTDSDYDNINQLEYRFVKLAMDGDEFNFISEFEDYMSLYLDREQ